jgi:hypothetical protein
MTDHDPTQPSGDTARMQVPPATPPWAAPPDPEPQLTPVRASVGLDVAAARVSSPPRGRSPVRWAVALLVVALTVAGGLGATLLLTGSTSGTSTVVAYAPADTVSYAEVRLDLPGSQRAEVAKTLAAFPGFADQAALDSKLAEVYDRIVRAASSSKHDYQTEIAPWFGGQLGVATGPSDMLMGTAAISSAAPSPTTSSTAALPPCTGGGASAPSPSSADATGVGREMRIRTLLLANVTDPARAEAWIAGIVAEQTTTTSDVTCDGVDVHLVTSGQAAGIPADALGWATLDGRVLVAGDLDSIRLAIATKGTSGLAATQGFRKAVDALRGDHVGFFYERVRATVDAQLGALAFTGTQTPAVALVSALASLVPEWAAADLRAADGNLVLDTAEPASDALAATNRPSSLAGDAPAGTIAFADVHDVGRALGVIRADLAADATLRPYVKQVDQVLGLVGGFDSAIGWIGDAGIAITRSGTTVSGGVLLRPDDAGAAKHLVTQLRSLAELAGVTSGVAITDEAYQGATITTVDLGELAPAITSQLGDQLGGMTVPSDLKLVYAVTDKVVVLTPEASFAKAVIDASQGGDSLAKDPRFSALLGKSGDSLTRLAWVDVAAVRDLAEGQLSADGRAKYEADYRPYLLPIDAMVSSGSIDNGLVRGTAILSIKH